MSKLNILWASTWGNAEDVAKHTEELAKSKGIETNLQEMNDNRGAQGISGNPRRAQGVEGESTELAIPESLVLNLRALCPKSREASSGDGGMRL